MEKKSLLRRGWFWALVLLVFLCAVLRLLGRERAFLPSGEITYAAISLGADDVSDRIPQEQLQAILSEVRLRGLPLDNGHRSLSGVVVLGNRLHAGPEVLEVVLAVNGEPLHLRLSPEDGYYAYTSGTWLWPVLDGAEVYRELLAAIDP